MPRNADARPLLTLGVVAHSRKENERRLPIHPMHFQRIDADLREHIYLENGYGESFGVTDEHRPHRPLRRADDARIIAPRATELHALRSAIPTRHTVMIGPWVPPPTSRAPAPCQITSAIPGHIALGVTPNTALSGPQTAERPQPRWGV